MDWEKVKKIVIVLLVLLNLGLLGLNLYNDGRHKLSDDRAATIAEVASRSGITLSCSLPERFEPMRVLALSPPAAEAEKLEKRFFGEAGAADVSTTGDGIFFHRGEETLTVAGSLIFYDNPAGSFPPAEFTEESARQSAEDYIRSLSGGADSVKEAYVLLSRDCYTFVYYPMYKGHCLYSTPRQVQVTKDGVIAYLETDHTVTGYTGSRESIYAADEAILAYCRLRSASGHGEGTEITAVELGYAIDTEAASSQSGGVIMVPCYAVYAAGEGAPTLINALTNTQIRK